MPGPVAAGACPAAAADQAARGGLLPGGDRAVSARAALPVAACLTGGHAGQARVPGGPHGMYPAGARFSRLSHGQWQRADGAAQSPGSSRKSRQLEIYGAPSIPVQSRKGVSSP